MHTNITIVSGRQNGTNQGALCGAMRLEIATAGCMSICAGDKCCTDCDIENVDMSDLVVAFLVKPSSGICTCVMIAYACGDCLPKECNSPLYGMMHMCVSGLCGDIIVVWDLNPKKVIILADLLHIMVYSMGYQNIMFSGLPECTSPGIAQFIKDLVVSAFGTANQ